MSNVAALIETNAAAMPDRLAIVDGATTLTYQQLCHRTNRLVEVLLDAGVRPGDRVAVRMQNRWEFFATSFAAWAIGAITVPINTRLHDAEVRYILGDSDAALVVTERDLHTPAVAEAWRVPVLVIDDADLTGSPMRPAVERLGGAVTRGGATQRLMYTSGTTSRPKAVIVTHEMVVHNMLSQARDLGLTGDDRLLVAGPLFHVAAFDAPGVAVLFMGGTIVLHRRFDATAVLESIAREQITGTVLVHPMGDRIVSAAASTAEYHSLRWLSVGARSPATARRMSEIFPSARLIQGYGLTEACGPVTSLRDRPDKTGTVGSPVAFVEIAIVDESGVPLPTSVQGEVAVRGPKVTPGYWNAPGGQRPPDAWLPTGDIGTLDPDGFLRLVDRKKDMIRTGGENVASSEIERVLLAHDAVVDCAVVAADDPRWGEVPAAFVVPADAASLTTIELDDHCAMHLARFKRPAMYRFVDELPRNATGKVRKVELRRLANEHNGSSQRAKPPSEGPA